MLARICAILLACAILTAAAEAAPVGCNEWFISPQCAKAGIEIAKCYKTPDKCDKKPETVNESLDSVDISARRRTHRLPGPPAALPAACDDHRFPCYQASTPAFQPRQARDSGPTLALFGLRASGARIAAGGALGSRPGRWCGWEMRRITGHLDRRLNVAWNWAVLFPRVPCGTGRAVVRPGHVGKIVEWTGDCRRTLVYSGNDSGTVQTRWRSVCGWVCSAI